MKEQSRENQTAAAIEAILFAMGTSVPLSVLAQALSLEEKETREAVEKLARSYEEEGRGIRIHALEGSYQMSTAPEMHEALIRVVVQPKRPVLTDVVLETLSIIAYKQPITKAELEKIRGVKSDHAVNKLVEYGLVEEKGRLEALGRPILFGTTEEFLRRFGISGLAELPVMNPDKRVDFAAEAEAEVRLTPND